RLHRKEYFSRCLDELEERNNFIFPCESSENRVILEAVSRFENAYVAFAGWLTELTTLNPPPMEVLPITLGRATPAGQPSVKSSTFAIITNTAKKSSLRVTLPLTRPPSSSAHSPDSPHPDDVVTPDDVGEVMARGNACFLAIQTAAEWKKSHDLVLFTALD
ncbi:hypothetical protein TSMEX_010866, partial [Taenia solium]